MNPFKVEYKGVNPNDEFSRHLQITTIPSWGDERDRFSILSVDTALSHYCGLNGLSKFAWSLFTKENVPHIIQTLKSIQPENYPIPWRVKTFVFFLGKREVKLLDKFITQTNAKLVHTFPSRSGYGEPGHPIYQYMIDFGEENV